MSLTLVNQTTFHNESNDIQADFDTFWLLWAGKRQEKKLCKIQWGYLLGPQQVAAVVGAAAWRPIWLRQDWRYLPEPLKWIHGERWEDELPRNVSASAAAHIAFEPSKEGERSVMPDHVKALIAKLRGQ